MGMTDNEYKEYKKDFMRGYNKIKQRKLKERIKKAAGDKWWIFSYINGSK
jgi:hypothetical protein